MNSLLEIAIVNAVMIVPLAFIAAAAGKLLHRPALTHVLWVLILIKLLTPPVWQIPLVDHDWLRTNAVRLLPRFLQEPEPLAEFRFPGSARQPTPEQSLRLNGDTGPIQNGTLRPLTLAEQYKGRTNRQPSLLGVAINWMQSETFPHLVTAVVMVIWGTGAILWLGVQGLRCCQFRWSLKRGTAAPLELQQFSDQLARRLGMTRSPTVWLMPGLMSPMLWGTVENVGSGWKKA